MKDKYTYTLLQYRHSPFLGECLNIGLLIYFHEEKKLDFIYTNNLSRVKAIYLNSPERILRNYVKEIDARVEKLNKNLDDFFVADIEERFDIFIKNYILPLDGSSVQFGKSISNWQLGENSKKIINHLKNSLLFEISTSKENREYEIGKHFYQSVKNYVNEVGESNNPNFFKDYIVENSVGVEFRFKYAWQNGSLNLVKPLNFDLSDSKQVANKGHLNYGQFVDLKDVAQKKNLRYDLIIGEPKKKGLIREFDHSIRLLEKLDNVKLISENNLTVYTQNLIETIKK